VPFPGEIPLVIAVAAIAIGAGIYYLVIPVPHPFSGEVRAGILDDYQTNFPWGSTVSVNWNTNDNSIVWFWLVCGWGMVVNQTNASSGSFSFATSQYSSNSETQSLVCVFGAGGGNFNRTVVLISGSYGAPRVQIG
jgi:hypothetical protein